MASATFGIELECISASKLQTNPARDIVRSWHKHRITKAKYRCIFSRSDDDDNELSPLNPTPNSSQSSSTNSDSSSQSKKSDKSEPELIQSSSNSDNSSYTQSEKSEPELIQSSSNSDNSSSTQSEKSEPELIQSRSEHYNKWSIKFERSIPYEIEDIENLLEVENLIYADDEKPHERAMKTMDGKYWVNHHPVELVSRILHFKKQPKEIKWDTEIKEVVGAFKDESDGKVRSMVNKRCGFHVHLGPPEGDKERSFEDLQKLASVFVLLEDLLDEMHPVHRRHGNPDIKSLSERYKTEDPENWQENAWDAIWSSSRRNDLIIAVNSIESDGGRFECRRWKVGLETNLNTTEVRVFEGTLDTEVIVGWVKFLEEFVRKTTSMSRGRLADLLLGSSNGRVKRVSDVTFPKHFLSNWKTKEWYRNRIHKHRQNGGLNFRCRPGRFNFRCRNPKNCIYHQN